MEYTFLTPWCSSYWKREPSGHPRLLSTDFIYFIIYILVLLTGLNIRWLYPFQKRDRHQMGYPRHDTKTASYGGDYTGDVRRVVYTFIPIIPISTLTRSGSTCQNHIYGSNTTV